MKSRISFAVNFIVIIQSGHDLAHVSMTYEWSDNYNSRDINRIFTICALWIQEAGVKWVSGYNSVSWSENGRCGFVNNNMDSYLMLCWKLCLIFFIQLRLLTTRWWNIQISVLVEQDTLNLYGNIQLSLGWVVILSEKILTVDVEIAHFEKGLNI